MSYNRNASIAWSREDIQTLGRLARENTPLIVMSMALGRTKAAIRKKASRQKISLKLRNQRPYAKRSKASSTQHRRSPQGWDRPGRSA